MATRARDVSGEPAAGSVTDPGPWCLKCCKFGCRQGHQQTSPLMTHMKDRECLMEECIIDYFVGLVDVYTKGDNSEAKIVQTEYEKDIAEYNTQKKLKQECWDLAMKLRGSQLPAYRKLSGQMEEAAKNGMNNELVMMHERIEKKRGKGLFRARAYEDLFAMFAEKEKRFIPLAVELETAILYNHSIKTYKLGPFVDKARESVQKNMRVRILPTITVSVMTVISKMERDCLVIASVSPSGILVAYHYMAQQLHIIDLNGGGSKSFPAEKLTQVGFYEEKCFILRKGENPCYSDSDYLLSAEFTTVLQNSLPLPNCPEYFYVTDVSRLHYTKHLIYLAKETLVDYDIVSQEVATCECKNASVVSCLGTNTWFYSLIRMNGSLYMYNERLKNFVSVAGEPTKEAIAIILCKNRTLISINPDGSMLYNKDRLELPQPDILPLSIVRLSEDLFVGFDGYRGIWGYFFLEERINQYLYFCAILSYHSILLRSSFSFANLLASSFISNRPPTFS